MLKVVKGVHIVIVINWGHDNVKLLN